MSLSDVAASIDAHNRQLALKDAYGHLAPEKNKPYKGIIHIFESAFGKQCGLDYSFNGLDSSPWLYEFIQREVSDWRLPYYGLYKWETSFRNYKLTGKPVLVYKTDETAILDPYWHSATKEYGEDGKPTGWENTITKWISLDGQPKRFSKTPVNIKFGRTFNQKLFDYHHHNKFGEIKI